MMKQAFTQWFVTLFLLLGMGVAQADSAPDEVIREAVDRLVQRIDAEREKLEKDPRYAQQVVDEELDAMVDFRRITRAVMGEIHHGIELFIHHLRSEEHTSELQSRGHLVCRLLLE